MKANRAALVLLGIGLVAGAGAQWLVDRGRASSLEQKLIDLEKRTAQAEAKSMAEKADLQKALAEKHERLAASETKMREDAERREAKRQANATLKQTVRATEIAGKKMDPATNDMWLADAQDPTVLRRLNEHSRLQINRRYASLFALLNLSPEQKEQLVNLLVDKRQAAVDVASATMLEGSDPRDDPAGYMDMIATMREDLEKQIHALLGDSGYQSYQNFDRSVAQAQVVTQLSQLLTEAQQPLSAAQTNQLVAVMQANNTGRVSAKVVNDAKAFLSPPQMEALRDLRAIQQANSRKRNTVAPALPTAPAHN